MNNTAQRAAAGQRSHPLPPDNHNTNALLRDRMWPGQVWLAWGTSLACGRPNGAVGLFIYHSAQPPVQSSVDATAW